MRGVDVREASEMSSYVMSRCGCKNDLVLASPTLSDRSHGIGASEHHLYSECAQSGGPTRI
jgi:hypothetical protein